MNISHDVAILFSMGQDNVSCDQLFTSRECVMLLQRRSNMHADMHELYQIVELIKESVLHGRRL